MKVTVSDDISGASAIEFAIIAPFFLLILMTMIGFALFLSVSNSIQQVAADAARTAIAGLNSAERQKLAKDFIASSLAGYALLEPEDLTVTVSDDPANPDQFTVTVEYDASHLPIWNLYSFAMPSSQIRQFSTIRLGGV